MKTTGKEKSKTPSVRYYRKRIELFRLVDKIKLWPSRNGLLHGIKTVEKTGDQAKITTHCNKQFIVNNSKTSRAARWLRNKWYKAPCKQCAVPDWKLEKYDATRFKRHHGSFLPGQTPST